MAQAGPRIKNDFITFKKAIGRRISDEIERSGMPKKDVAKIINVHYDTIMKWQRGTTTPTVENLFSLSQLLGIKPEHFFSDLPFEFSRCESEIAELKSRIKELELKNAILKGQYSAISDTLTRIYQK